jgi:hypothetical protein
MITSFRRSTTSVVVVLDRNAHPCPEQDKELMGRLERRAKGR